MTTNIALYPWQTQQWQRFCEQQKQQRLAHAIIVSGVAGLGKASFANAMVASVLCESAESDVACGKCHSCNLFASGNHPDHTAILPEQGSSSIKIEQIRSLKDKQELTPTVANWKTVIISPADKMTISAFNSVLKLLEEPQNNTLIILVTAQSERLPITITSRCQTVKLSSPQPQLTLQWLEQQQQIDSATLALILPLSNGAPLAALTMLQNGLVEQIHQLNSDFESLLSGNANPIEMTKKWLQYDPLLIFHHLQHLIKHKLCCSQDELSNNNSKRYWYIYDCIISAIKLTSSSNNINKTLLIEQFMVAIMDKSLSSTLTVTS